MAAAAEEFGIWLDDTLKKLNIDESVFGSYIRSILDSDESPDEKSDALREILSEIIGNEEEIGIVCNDILEKWLLQPKEPPPTEISSEEVDTKLVKLLESQSMATTKQKRYTEEEKKIREAILSQYSQMTDDEAEEDEVATTKHAAGESKDLEKNMNVFSVQHAEKIKREQAKLDSQKKKDKDKEDREKQKQQKEEKKEKRKTQKGERKR